MEESLRIALAADEPEHACRAYVNLILYDLQLLRLGDARRLLTEGIEFAERSDFVMFSRYLQVALGERCISRPPSGTRSCRPRRTRSTAPRRCDARAVTLIGRTRLRRGEPGAVETLREAWRIALPLRECQWIGPAAAALAEAAMLGGDAGAAVAELTQAYELSRRFGTVAIRAELAYWLGRAGRPVGGGGLDHPYALLADGRWREAAEVWRAAGCRYEYAAALAESPEQPSSWPLSPCSTGWGQSRWPGWSGRA